MLDQVNSDYVILVRVISSCQFMSC